MMLQESLLVKITFEENKVVLDGKIYGKLQVPYQGIIIIGVFIVEIIKFYAETDVKVEFLQKIMQLTRTCTIGHGNRSLYGG